MRASLVPNPITFRIHNAPDVCSGAKSVARWFRTVLVKLRSPLSALLTILVLAPLAATTEPVRISTFVTDRQGKPVPGLTIKDFELREEDVVQQIVSVESRKPEPRRLAILLDEFHVDASDSARVREAVTRFVNEQMRADDTAVILKPLDPLTTIRLSADRNALLGAIEAFEGRKGNFEPRSPLEEETMGRAPALVEAGRAQVVLSGLRALATQLGSSAGRSAILLVSEGFTRQPSRRLTVRGLPDAATVEGVGGREGGPV
jgi:VWFA-related protein